MDRTFHVGDYELVCTAQARDNGLYEPSLTITKLIWPTRTRVIAMRSEPTMSEELAIASAYAQGLEWIKNFG